MPPKNDAAKKENGDAVDTTHVPAPPLVQLTSPWLSSLTSRIRSRPIPWEGYARADLVSQDELKMIRSIDTKQGNDTSVLDSRGEEYATLYLRLLTKLSRTDTLQQVLVLMGDMVEARDDRLQLFFQAATKLQSADAMNEDKKAHQDADNWPWAPLVRLLSISDDFAQLKAAHFITLLLVAPHTSHSSTLTRNATQDVLSKLLSFLASLINTGTVKSKSDNDAEENGRNAASSSSSPARRPGSGALAVNPSPDAYADGNGADIAIQLLEALLRTQHFRRFVWKDEMKRQSNAGSHENTDDGASPGVIRGLVYILQNAIVAPNGKKGAEDDDSKDRDDRKDNGNSPSSSSSSSSSPSSSSQRQRPVTFQTQYEVIFCLWLLSFDPQISSQLNRKFNVIPLLSEIARSAVKEKVIRVCVATLKNLLATPGESNDNAVVMLGCKVAPLVENFKERKWSDEDIGEDFEYIGDALTEKLRGMSTLDEYLSELASGKLTWDNPAHDLDDFWRANAQKLLEESSSKSAIPESEQQQQQGQEDDNDEDGSKEPRTPLTGLTRLLTLLGTSKDDMTLAVAVHDVGKIIQFTETGRKKVNEARVRLSGEQEEEPEEDQAEAGSRFSTGKIQVMRLMSHSDPEVKYRALSTVGRLMSASWK